MDILDLVEKIVQITYYALNGVNLVTVLKKERIPRRQKKRICYRQRKWYKKRKRNHVK